MKSDLYTKAVLTVIAVILTVIAAKTLGNPATIASAQTRTVTVKVTADNWDDESRGSSANIAKLSWVNKRCRMWGGGDIDIDQTCLVVRTVKGGLVVIPNVYVDEDSQETSDQLGKVQANRDKWLLRFYEIGGGRNPRNEPLSLWNGSGAVGYLATLHPRRRIKSEMLRSFLCKLFDHAHDKL